MAQDFLPPPELTRINSRPGKPALTLTYVNGPPASFATLA